MRDSLEAIKKKKDMQKLRSYINSLWKWKLSNFEANYYSKFIKVFKESEELIILSNSFNKKLYQNLHHSFRAILRVGTDRQNRKTHITEKYLMRKYRNYFQIFKFNVHQQETKTWKNKYTEAIKGQQLVKAIYNLVQNHNLSFFNSL